MTFVLELEGIHKRFGAVDALRGATLCVRPGTVHALLGENGAGKSTLMRVAFGMLRPDAGTLRIEGRDVRLANSAEAMARGVGMVHQHFTLVPAMTVAENVALGMHGSYDARAAAARVHQLAARAGLPLDPNARVDTLPVGAQQRLEIVKALARDARLLILDEPTAVLAPDEVDDLLRWIRRSAADGRAVVLITHKLREAMAVADDVTVLRRGATVRAAAAVDLDEGALVTALLGDDVAARTDPLPASVTGEHVASPTPAAPRASEVVAALHGASVRDARGRMVVKRVTMAVHAGEILGVAAVEGSGQHELLRLLAGRLAPSDGTCTLPADIAFIPEDRHRDAMVLDMTLVENVALRALPTYHGRMPWPAIRQATDALLERFDVRTGGAETPVRTLSGGNQQKLVLGRELASRPPLVVAENPTRGLDIRASAAVHEHLRAARDAGSAVVLYSSDLDEVLVLADRMLVVHGGGVVDVDPPTREAVGRAMLGAPVAPPARAT